MLSCGRSDSCRDVFCFYTPCVQSATTDFDYKIYGTDRSNVVSEFLNFSLGHNSQQLRNFWQRVKWAHSELKLYEESKNEKNIKSFFEQP